MKYYRFSLLPAISILLICCTDKQNGPFFGNGVHNGWADQNSIVIWTRLTKTPEMNLKGPAFLKISAEEHRKLNKEANVDSIYAAQIPSGYSLEQMEGACPGMDGEVRLTCYPLKQPDNKIVKEWTPVSAVKNFTIQWALTGLQPGTKYVIDLQARQAGRDEITASISGSFRTPPPSDSTAASDFAIVTCQDYPRRDDSIYGHKIYKSMLKPFPDFFIHTGDIEYYDKPLPFALTEELMRFKWDRIFALPNQRDFYRQVTTYYMKDDHDALVDDAFPGKTYGTVSYGRGIEIFDREQFPSNDLPYKTIRWGKDLQIWIMEGRNFRSKNTDPDGPGKTIWGKEQKEWLFRTMSESDATFKLLVSQDPILGPDRTNKFDNYSNSSFRYEGDEIRNFLKQLNNVFICNGDRHWQYVTNIPGTTLWEFGCGPSSDAHAEGWPPNDMRPEHRFLRVKGGYLRGKTWRSEGIVHLQFQHCDVEGNVVHEENFKVSNPEEAMTDRF
jgi:alkaline phosphatase D